VFSLYFRRGKLRKPLIGLLSVVLVASLASPSAQAAFPGLNGKIAFYTGQGTSDNIWVMQPDGSGLTPITSAPSREWDPAWSPDGTKIAFVLDEDIWTMSGDGSGMVNRTNDPAGDGAPTWSPDGTKIAFVSTRSGDFGSKIYVMNADGTDVTRITNELTPDSQPAWSPDGRIAFVRHEHVYTMDADGSDITQVTGTTTSDYDPTWSPNGARIAYVRSNSSPENTPGVHTVDADGSNDVDLSLALTEAHDPAFSPDGSKLVVSRNGHVWTMNTDGSGATQLTTVAGTNGDPDWQPLPFTGYARPRTAPTLRVPLVPAYDPCAAPNRTHGPPLAFGSCNPPAQASANLTVGTPDAGGGAANSSGFFFIRTHAGTPGPPDDSGAPIQVSISDVRCRPPATTCADENASNGADYTGELQAEFTLRTTDKWNATSAGGGADSATVTDFTFPVPVTCASTASTSEGALCETQTDALVIFPGSVRDTKRAVWDIGQIQVFDGGADGDAETADNSLFAVQGLFVP
jgi:TolB protein